MALPLQRQSGIEGVGDFAYEHDLLPCVRHNIPTYRCRECKSSSDYVLSLPSTTFSQVPRRFVAPKTPPIAHQAKSPDLMLSMWSGKSAEIQSRIQSNTEQSSPMTYAQVLRLPASGPATQEEVGPQFPPQAVNMPPEITPTQSQRAADTYDSYMEYSNPSDVATWARQSSPFVDCNGTSMPAETPATREDRSDAVTQSSHTSSRFSRMSASTAPTISSASSISASASNSMTQPYSLKHTRGDFFDRRNPHSCVVCGQSYDSKGRLRRHQRQVHGSKEGQYPCSYCDEQFNYRREVDRHVAAAHPEDSLDHALFYCSFPDCPRGIEGFMREDHCDRHVRSVHYQGGWEPML
ncbi:Hypothetical protein R9X50_00551000 [Acrodontium crateriforme]|uniref:C2H2-type domain-containing protein n=1 Tax=Acrodontium crateriforme TaxID=150365 RepID=A0AAQ3M832_9PEZI|nr:Hypothetical protein R9X50_00551000 [Acrodontium crateriforme]